MKVPLLKNAALAAVAAGTLGLLAPLASSAQYCTTYETEYYGGYAPYTTRVITSPVVVEPAYTRSYYSQPGLMNLGVPGLANINVGGYHLLHVGLPFLHMNLF